MTSFKKEKDNNNKKFYKNKENNNKKIKNFNSLKNNWKDNNSLEGLAPEKAKSRKKVSGIN
jgi:hypothetical protein